MNAELKVFFFVFFVMTSPRLSTEEQQQLPAASSYPPFCVLKDHVHPLGLGAVGIVCAVLILYRADFFLFIQQ